MVVRIRGQQSYLDYHFTQNIPFCVPIRLFFYTNNHSRNGRVTSLGIFPQSGDILGATVHRAGVPPPCPGTPHPCPPPPHGGRAKWGWGDGFCSRGPWDVPLPTGGRTDVNGLPCVTAVGKNTVRRCYFIVY